MFCGSQNYWHFCNSEFTDFVFIKSFVFDFWIYFAHLYARSVFRNFSIRKLKKRGFPHFCLKICVLFWLRSTNSDHTSFIPIVSLTFGSLQPATTCFSTLQPVSVRYNLFQYAPACPNPLHLTRFNLFHLTRFNPLQTASTLSIRFDSVHSNPLLTTPFRSRQMAKYRKRFSNQNNLNVQRISAVNTFAISNASPSVQLLTQISSKEFVPLLLLSRQYCPHRTIIIVSVSFFTLRINLPNALPL